MQLEFVKSQVKTTALNYESFKSRKIINELTLLSHLVSYRSSVVEYMGLKLQFNSIYFN